MFYQRYMTKSEYRRIVAQGLAREGTPDEGVPHCNSEVLHAPGSCAFCDGHPRRQAARVASNTPFTPAEANGWGGNVAPEVDDEKAVEEDQAWKDMLTDIGGEG